MESVMAIGDSIAFLKEALDCSPLGIIICNRWLRVVFISRSVLAITHLQSENVVGHRLSDIIGRENVTRFVRRVRGGTGRGWLDLFSSIEGYGKPKGLRVIVSPIVDEGSQGFKGAIIFLDELNEMKEMNRKLIEMERLSAIRETAISINHEINNPLCSILGNTQLLLMEKDRLDPVVVEKLERIEDDIERIHEIAEKLTRITKPVLSEYVSGKKMLDIKKSGL